MRKPFVIGVAGGSGSGKTTVARNILERAGTTHVAHLLHDNYYHDLAHLSFEERSQVNFDHPDSLDNDLFIEHLKALLERRTIAAPKYDFKTHRRTEETVAIEPRPVILVEGILIFADPALRALMDLRIFVDTDADLRVLRRIKRDVAERGRHLETVIDQYLNSVRPMHNEFVAPSKKHANIVLPEGGMNQMAIEVLIAKVDSILKRQTAPLQSNAVH
ncbi:MAG: uridine kinase [Candidatus Sericytochromatia bacterium]|nr:uridine kinase [Candidatus Sericytochromatia bacterium]